jgi:hypothetical protein
MMADNGGSANTADWAQFYFVPGIGHCGGGDQTLDNFDMLSALDNWVVNQQPSKQVVAKGQSMPDISRPLYPYPKIPFYDGQSDSKNSSAFICRNPR